MEADWDSDGGTQHDINMLNIVLEGEEPLPSELSSAPPQLRQRYYNIQQAITANRLVDEKLRRLESILVRRLAQCRKKLEEVVETPVAPDKQDKGFKWTPPEKEATILMPKSNMYDFLSIISVPGWTVKDMSECLSIIHKMSIDIRKKELYSKLAELEYDFETFETNKKKHVEQIETIKTEIDCLKNKSLDELALPIDQEYDWDVLANQIGYRHNALEVSALWKLLLHPSINKSTWTKTEYMKLQEIAHENNLQDWEKIAKELNTGRTAYQCFVYFRTNKPEAN